MAIERCSKWAFFEGGFRGDFGTPFLVNRGGICRDRGRSAAGVRQVSAMHKCPICKSEAEELERGPFEGFTIHCSTHGEIEFSDTARSARWGEPRERWERALQNAKNRAVLGKRPRIMDDDFF